MQKTLNGSTMDDGELEILSARQRGQNVIIAFGEYCAELGIKYNPKNSAPINALELCGKLQEHFGAFTEDMINALELYHKLQQRGVV